MGVSAGLGLPKSAQPKAKQALWIAEGRDDAKKAFDGFLSTYEAKFPKATDCLTRDRTQLLASYDFPAEHGIYLRDHPDRIDLRHRPAEDRPDPWLPLSSDDGGQALGPPSDGRRDAAECEACGEGVRMRQNRGRWPLT